MSIQNNTYIYILTYAESQRHLNEDTKNRQYRPSINYKPREIHATSNSKSDTKLIISSTYLRLLVFELNQKTRSILSKTGFVLKVSKVNVT